MRSAFAAVALAACEELEGTPCEAVAEPSVVAAPAGVAFGAWVDGEPLFYGVPPQGGAPYTPLHARAAGLSDPQDGVTITLSGTDADSGEELGFVEIPTRLLCANVGDDAGTWVAADVHFRYFGWEMDALSGRTAEITFEIADLDGNVVSDVLVGVLDPPDDAEEVEPPP